MTQRSPLTTALSGVSGEYFVAAELSRRGFIASLTLKNTRGIDILASSADASRQVAIQVKTNQGSGENWVLNQEAETQCKPRLFYVFVRLNRLGNPEYYVVPSKVVAKQAKDRHKSWLNNPGRKGQQHKDVSMRKFGHGKEKYLNRWSVLKLGGTTRSESKAGC
jgi:hypothetical protein